MENELKSSEVKTKNITLGSIVGWIFGILVGAGGIFGLFSDPIPSIFFILAAIIVLPPANKILKEKLHISLSKGVKIVLVLVFLAIAGSQIGEKAKSPEAIKTSDNNAPVEQVTALKVTAVQLAEAYKANEVAADAKYKGKALEISGLVGNIGKDILDTPYITFQTEQYAIINQVQCMFAKNDEQILATLSKGQSVKVSGEVSGSMGNIIVKGCRIVN